ncbi:hypothetical protein AJ80_04054 [Polytolypa hystricis UAMH7299]|uniref:RING-type E3 ubiquitin transferase n=1 Tax=Polytolypa hystricis (strain UAMH7299) TaxID=1447883 RepID=A0A2B7YE22_POLH7|nr:hypothetical protein AJ80_04054 [Polytolypa hystricis UAMH7299]
MTHNAGLQQEVLQKTLEEVAHNGHGNHVSNPCVICLDQITEPAITLPCEHASFDFVCIASWLQQRPACPLCQAQVTAVNYDLKAPQGPKTYSLPPPETAKPAQGTAGPQYGRSRPLNLGRRRQRPRRPRPTIDPDDPILRRRHIYRHQLYSRRVGSNRLSRYTEITPQHINNDPDLVSRARKWIRRELQVFEFLNPENAEGSSSSSSGVAMGRRANNAEFLLEYIIAILRTVDLKGSAGQAEELLQEFLGGENARLFLHELQAWLRSPYNSLQDWDRAVQYDESAEASAARPARSYGEAERPLERQSASDRRGPVERRRGMSHAGRVEKRRARGWSPRSPRNLSNSRASRVQSARRRYEPD